jgi:hypothetical protein
VPSQSKNKCGPPIPFSNGFIRSLKGVIRDSLYLLGRGCLSFAIEMIGFAGASLISERTADIGALFFNFYH